MIEFCQFLFEFCGISFPMEWISPGNLMHGICLNTHFLTPCLSLDKGGNVK